MLCGTAFQKRIVHAGSHKMVRPERRQALVGDEIRVRSQPGTARPPVAPCKERVQP